MKGNSSSSSTSKKLAKPLPPPRSRNPPSKASEQRSLCSELEDVACLSMRELVAQKIKGNPSLAELDLSWSLTASFERIKKIEGVEVIRGLRVLKLTSNRIERIEGLVCASLTLTHLDLAHNRLASLENLQQLSRLERLNVGHNRIGELKADWFSNLKALSSLDLQHNCLTRKRDLFFLDCLAPTLEHLSLHGNPITNYKDTSLKALPGLLSLDNLTLHQTAATSSELPTTTVGGGDISASLTKYLRGSVACNSAEDSLKLTAGSRRFLMSDRREPAAAGGSPALGDSVDPGVVKKLMKEIHSLKCENTQMQEQLMRSSSTRRPQTSEAKATSRPSVAPELKRPTDEMELTRRDRELAGFLEEQLPSQDTQQGPGSKAPSTETKKVKRELEFSSPSRGPVLTPESLTECREALLLAKGHLSSCKEQGQELTEQLAVLEHQLLQKRQAREAAQDKLSEVREAVEKHESDRVAKEEELVTKKLSPAYQIQEKRELVKQHMREADELRERLLWEQKQISEQKEHLHQKTEHLLLLRSQMNDRSIESYLSDSNCFFFEEERQSAQEIAELEKQLTKREDAARQMVVRIDHLSAQIPELERDVQVLADFLTQKQFELAQKGLASAEVFYNGAKTALDEPFLAEALNPDTPFPGQQVHLIQDNIAELKRGLDTLHKSLEMAQSQLRVANQEYHTVQQAVDRVKAGLRRVRAQQSEKAQLAEELESHLGRDCSPLTYSTSGVLQQGYHRVSKSAERYHQHHRRVDTPPPFCAMGQLSASTLVDQVIALSREMSKLAEKVRELTSETEYEQQHQRGGGGGSAASRSLGLALIRPQSQEQCDIETMLRPLRAPNTAVSKATITSLETALQQLTETASQSYINLAGAIQTRRPDAAESVVTTPTKKAAAAVGPFHRRSPMERKGRSPGAIHIKETFMGKRSLNGGGSSMNSSLFRTGGMDDYDLARQSRDVRRLQGMLEQAKSTQVLDTSLMSEIQEEVARIVGQNNGLHDFKVHKQLHKLAKTQEYTQRLQDELNAAYDEISNLQDELKSQKKERKAYRRQEAEDLELRLALLQSDVEQAEQRRDALNQQSAQIRVARGNAIIVDDKGCLTKYLREAYDTILEIKARKKADKENEQPQPVRKGRHNTASFANRTTNSMIRSHRTPSPHSRSGSQPRLRHTTTPRGKWRSRSGTPRREVAASCSHGAGGGMDDTQLLRVAKEIRNYMVRLSRDFGKIYKVKENKDKLVQYFEKEALELSKSWALLQDRTADMDERTARVTEREEVIGELLQKATGGKAGSMLPQELLKAIQSNKPAAASHSRAGSDPAHKVAAEEAVLRNLEMEIAFYKTELEKLKAQVHKQQNSRTELQNELDEKRGQNQEEERKRRELAHELKTHQEIVMQMQRERHSLHQTLQKTRGELSQLQREKHSVQDSLLTLDERKKRLHSTVAFEEASLQQEFQTLDTRVAERQQRLLSIQVAIERAEQEWSTKSEQVKQAQGKLEMLGKSLAGSEKERQEREILKTRLGEMREEVASLSSQLIDREKSLRHLQRAENQLGNRQEELSESVGALQQELAQKQSEAKMLESRIRQKKEALAQSQEELENSRERAQEVQAAAQKAELKLLQIQENSKAKEESFSRYQGELASFLDEMAQSRKTFDAQKRHLEAEIDAKRSVAEKIASEVLEKQTRSTGLQEEVRHLGQLKREAQESFELLSNQQQDMQLQMAEKLQKLKERVEATKKQLGEVRGLVKDGEETVAQREEEIALLDQRREELIEELEQGNQSMCELRDRATSVQQSVSKLEERKNVLNIELALYGERPDLEMQERITQITKSAQEAELLRRELENMQQEKLEMSQKLEHYQEVFSDIKAHSLLESGVKVTAAAPNSFASCGGVGIGAGAGGGLVMSPLHPSGISFISGIDSARSQGTGRFDTQCAEIQRALVPRLNLQGARGAAGGGKRSSRNERALQQVQFMSPDAGSRDGCGGSNLTMTHSRTKTFEAQEVGEVPQSARERRGAMLMKPIDDMIKRLDMAKGRIEKLSARGKRRTITGTGGFESNESSLSGSLHKRKPMNKFRRFNQENNPETHGHFTTAATTVLEGDLGVVSGGLKEMTLMPSASPSHKSENSPVRARGGAFVNLHLNRLND